MLLYTTAFIAACNWATRHEVRSAERQEEQLQQEEIAAECSSLVCCELRKRNLVLFRLVDRVDHESPRLQAGDFAATRAAGWTDGPIYFAITRCSTSTTKGSAPARRSSRRGVGRDAAVAYAREMLLVDGYHDVPTGALATVVTYLEMTAPPPARVERTARPWTLRPVTQPGLDWYRGLYRRVGADWLWSSRLVLTDAALSAILGGPLVELHALVADGRDEGLLELDFRVPGECELAFFGLGPALVGHGAGRWLMNQALVLAWSRPIHRFWLHTCTLDAPQALPFYVRSGFVPYAREVEVYDDPRLTGVLPETAAPHVPLIRR